MDLPTLWLAVGGGAGVVVSVAAAAAVIGKPLRKLSRDNDEFREDWYGQAARPGRDREAGVMERLRGIEKELHPNGGSSLRDAVGRLETRFEDHLRTHPIPPSGTP